MDIWCPLPWERAHRPRPHSWEHDRARLSANAPFNVPAPGGLHHTPSPMPSLPPSPGPSPAPPPAPSPYSSTTPPPSNCRRARFNRLTGTLIVWYWGDQVVRQELLWEPVREWNNFESFLIFSLFSQNVQKCKMPQLINDLSQPDIHPPIVNKYFWNKVMKRKEKNPCTLYSIKSRSFTTYISLYIEISNVIFYQYTRHKIHVVSGAGPPYMPRVDQRWVLAAVTMGVLVSLEVEAGLTEDRQRWGLVQEVPWERRSHWRSKLPAASFPKPSSAQLSWPYWWITVLL